MTTNGAGPRETNARTDGTVFDIGYQSYSGTREGLYRSRIAMFKNGVRSSLGLGRGAWPKVLPWLFIFVLVSIAFIWAIVVGAVWKLGGGPEEISQLPGHSAYYGVASIIIFIFAAVGAPELLCPDRRLGVINLYLVRPLTGTDYVFTRWLAFFFVMMLVTWLPQLILFVGLCMGNPQPVEYLKYNWFDIPKAFLAGAAIAAYSTTLGLLVAAFTTRRAYAAVFLVGLFVITTPFTTGLAMEIGGTAGRWISMFNLSNIPVHVNDLIFGEPSGVTSAAPAGEFPGWVLVSWFFLWTLGPAGILWLRYRKLTP